MEKKRILIVTQEMLPYLEQSSMAKLIRLLAPHIQSNKYEIRLLMPKFGIINEKRHRLHEVVRLSGINIPVGEDDNPLIIKVASLPDAKMQVYFIDNDELFGRKFVNRDENNQFFDDNDVRTAFFCKGVMETVVKLGWKPDIIHCNGWMTSLIPLYHKTVYKNEPIFAESKVLYSVYENSFTEHFREGFDKKMNIADGIQQEQLDDYGNGDFNTLNLGAIKHSDGVIVGHENIDPVLKTAIGESNKPVLEAQEESEYLDANLTFLKEVLGE